MGAIKSNTLHALTLAALALPGIRSEAEVELFDGAQFNYQYAHYAESDERVSVDINQGSIVFPSARDFQLTANWVVDSWSGATPVLTLPQSATETITGASGITGINTSKRANNNAQAIQVMTGASPQETRYGVDLGLSYLLQDLTINVGLGRSEEPDYLSHTYHIGMDWKFNQKLSTLSLGFGQNFDRVEPTTRALKERRTDYLLQLGFSQILDKNSLLRVSMNYSAQSGYLSNPYKKVYIQDLPAGQRLENGGYDNVYFENRPRQRHLGSLSIGYNYFFSAWDAALHADYRFFRDSWNIESHTFELTWYQPVGRGWMVVPRLRYYSQTSANFQQLFFSAPRTDGFYSSDFRLDSFGTLSGGLSVSKEILQSFGLCKSLKIEAGVEYTRHSTSLGLAGNSVSELTDFDYILASVDFRIQF